jgi:PhnB protein
MALTPYLFFDGTCEQALDFYRDALGAETVSLMRYKDGPPMEGVPAEHANRVMHASVRIQGSDVMASDGPTQPFQGFSLSLSAPDAEAGQKLFDKLAAGGQVTMPYGKTFWTSGFGMCKDKFGVPWMVNAEH